MLKKKPKMIAHSFLSLKLLLQKYNKRKYFL